MERMPYWIQRADFSSAENEAVDVERAIELVSVPDWSNELRLFDALEAAGREVCPPGIGFVASPGRILHILSQKGRNRAGALSLFRGAHDAGRYPRIAISRAQRECGFILADS